MSLKTRTITGLTFGAVMIGGCLFSHTTCTILFLIIALLCLWELSGHVLTQDGTANVNVMRQALYVVVGMFVPILTAMIYAFGQGEIYKMVYFYPILLFFLFLFELFGKSAKPFDNLAFVFLGLIYIALPFTLLLWITNANIPALGGAGNQFILATMFMVWASDVFAYLLGSKIGRTKMFPRISPNKTWEGTLSGVAGALLTGYLCSLVFTSLSFPLVFWLGLACICTIFGILGDLVESMLKRSLGIKDSGNMLPGHGGFLDRFDALIFVIPFVYTYIVVYFGLW